MTGKGPHALGVKKNGGGKADATITLHIIYTGEICRPQRRGRIGTHKDQQPNQELPRK